GAQGTRGAPGPGEAPPRRPPRHGCRGRAPRRAPGGEGAERPPHGDHARRRQGVAPGAPELRGCGLTGFSVRGDGRRRNPGMVGVVRSSVQVMAALWVGALFCLGFVVAPYLFALAARHSPAVPDTGVAAGLLGPLLYGADIASLAVAAVLLAALV